MRANHRWSLIIIVTVFPVWICILESRKQSIPEHDSQTAESQIPKIQVPNTAIGLKLSVLRSGKLLANDVEIRFDQLDLELSKAKCFEACIGYYVEDGEGEPPPIAEAVINRIGRYRLSVSMSSKPDFSDIIDEPS